MKKTKLVAIIAAGGLSIRMQGINKLTASLNGKPILAYSIEKLEKNRQVSEIILVARRERILEFKKIIQKYKFKKIKKIVRGGKTRMHSINNGIEEAKDSDFLLICDAARPLTSESLIDDVIKTAEKFGAAVVGCRPKDVIQSVNEKGFVEKTFDRNNLIAVHSPFVAKTELILKARKNAIEKGFFGNDSFEDSALLNLIGIPVKVVWGSYDNIKITTLKDLGIAEKILRNKRNSGNVRSCKAN